MKKSKSPVEGCPASPAGRLADWQTGLQRPHHTEPTCRTHLALPTPLDEVTTGPQPYLHSGHIPAQGAGSAPS